MFIRLFFLFVLAFAGRLLKQNHLLVVVVVVAFTVDFPSSSSRHQQRLEDKAKGNHSETHDGWSRDSYMKCADVRLFPSRFASPLETLFSSVRSPFAPSSVYSYVLIF